MSATAMDDTREKSLFRIGEVSRLTATKPFVLRYWETEFPMLQPVKSPKGHRLYRREDIETVFEIKRLLYDEGFTIAGARRHLRKSKRRTTPGGDPAAVCRRESRRRPRRRACRTLRPCRREAPTRDSRKLLLDLRENCCAFLTLLESE